MDFKPFVVPCTIVLMYVMEGLFKRGAYNYHNGFYTVAMLNIWIIYFTSFHLPLSLVSVCVLDDCVLDDSVSAVLPSSDHNDL